MNVVESYLEKGWGDSVDNPKLADIEIAIKEIQKMDDEHGAFWIGVYGDDNKEGVLEADKNLRLTLILDPENCKPETFNQKTSHVENWEEILKQFKLLLRGEVDKIEGWLNK